VATPAAAVPTATAAPVIGSIKSGAACEKAERPIKLEITSSTFIVWVVKVLRDEIKFFHPFITFHPSSFPSS